MYGPPVLDAHCFSLTAKHLVAKHAALDLCWEYAINTIGLGCVWRASQTFRGHDLALL